MKDLLRPFIFGILVGGRLDGEVLIDTGSSDVASSRQSAKQRRGDDSVSRMYRFVNGRYPRDLDRFSEESMGLRPEWHESVLGGGKE